MDVKINNSKRSQITIFIILGVIIVVIIAILFLVKRPPQADSPDENNPQAYIKACTREAVEDAIKILLPQGGDINPKGSVLYDGIERTYHCYNSEYYEPCINQRPMLVEHIEEEITNYTRPKIEACFRNLKTILEGRYEITEKQLKMTTKLKPKQVIIEIDKYFKMTRGDKILEFEEFDMNLFHPIYDLAEVAMEIVNQEARYCNFNNIGFMIIHPAYDITKFETGSGDTIYKVKDRKTGQELVFAIRSCRLPAGT